MLLQVCALMITVLIYIDRTALFIICIYFNYCYCYNFCVCVVQYNSMCLSCSTDLVAEVRYVRIKKFIIIIIIL